MRLLYHCISLLLLLSFISCLQDRSAKTKAGEAEILKADKVLPERDATRTDAVDTLTPIIRRDTLPVVPITASRPE